MDQLTKGLKVHYTQPNGAHSDAEVTYVWNQNEGVVNLQVHRDDKIKDDYAAATVVYSAKPKPYTWHFVEDDKETENDQTQPIHSV